jgi:hypothetical protein
VFSPTQTNVAYFFYVTTILNQKLKGVEVAILGCLNNERCLSVVVLKVRVLLAWEDLTRRILSLHTFLEE